MKNLLQALLFAAGLITAAAAHAGPSIDTHGFSLWQEGDVTSLSMQVVSEHDGLVQIAFQGLQPAAVVAIDDGNNPWYSSDFTMTPLEGTVKAGYRIASMTLSGTVTGTPEVGMPTSCDLPSHSCRLGQATSTATLDWSTTVGEHGVGPGGSLKWVDLNGTRTFSLTGTAPVSGNFDLWFDIYNVVYAEASTHSFPYDNEDGWYTAFIPSQSAFAFGDLTLTMQVVAVPEPGTYAMLLGGLGLLGVAARRRR